MTNKTNKTARLSWGLQPPSAVTVAWGARAVSCRGSVDLLWDRQGAVGSPPERKRVVDERYAIGVRVQYGTLGVEASPLGPSGRQQPLQGGSDGEWIVEADTRGSCGYVYVVAYPTSEPSPASLYALTPDGHRLRVHATGDDRFTLMGGRYGDHSLHRSCTSHKRLAAHFAGYAQANLEGLK